MTCKTILNLMPKPVSRYTYIRKKDGSMNIIEGYMCRVCHTIRMLKYRRTKNGAIKTRQAMAAERARNPHKQQARMLLAKALRTGEVIRPSYCAHCGIHTKPDGHHHDYAKPLDVQWLCRSCHADLHRK